ANAVLSVSRYLGKLVWPHDLIVFYPYRVPSSASIALAVLVLLCISTATIVWRRSVPWLFVGWWWFLIGLLPVIGLVQVGAQAIADRYMCWPSIGAFVAFVWAASYVSNKLRCLGRFWACSRARLPQRPRRQRLGRSVSGEMAKLFLVTHLPLLPTTPSPILTLELRWRTTAHFRRRWPTCGKP